MCDYDYMKGLATKVRSEMVTVVVPHLTDTAGHDPGGGLSRTESTGDGGSDVAGLPHSLPSSTGSSNWSREVSQSSVELISRGSTPVGDPPISRCNSDSHDEEEEEEEDRKFEEEFTGEGEVKGKRHDLLDEKEAKTLALEKVPPDSGEDEEDDQGDGDEEEDDEDEDEDEDDDSSSDDEDENDREKEKRFKPQIRKQKGAGSVNVSRPSMGASGVGGMSKNPPPDKETKPRKEIIAEKWKNAAKNAKGRPLSDDAEHTAYVEWLKSNDVKMDQIGFGVWPIFGRGQMCMGEAIPTDTPVVTVPKSVMMTSHTAFEGTLSKVYKENRTLLKDCHLSVQLLFEKHNPKSFWAPWINILPKTLTTPLFYSEKEIAEFKGSNIGKLIKKREKEVKDLYDSVFPLLFEKYPEFFNPNVHTLEEFKWVYATERARCFCISEGYAFVPGADMFNHRPSNAPACDFGYDDEKEVFVVTATSRLCRGDQIFVDYGHNLECMHHTIQDYGFIPEDPKNDYVDLTLKIPKTDECYKDKRRLAWRCDLSNSFTLRLKKTPLEMMGALRIIAMTPAQVKRAIDLDPDDLVEEVLRSVNKYSDVETLRSFSVICRARIQQYTTTISYDEALLKTSLSKNVRNAVLCRYREKLIIDSTIKWATNKIAQLKKKFPKADRQATLKRDAKNAARRAQVREELEKKDRGVDSMAPSLPPRKKSLPGRRDSLSIRRSSMNKGSPQKVVAESSRGSSVGGEENTIAGKENDVPAAVHDGEVMTNFINTDTSTTGAAEPRDAKAMIQASSLRQRVGSNSISSELYLLPPSNMSNSASPLKSNRSSDALPPRRRTSTMTTTHTSFVPIMADGPSAHHARSRSNSIPAQLSRVLGSRLPLGSKDGPSAVTSPGGRFGGGADASARFPNSARGFKHLSHGPHYQSRMNTVQKVMMNNNAGNGVQTPGRGSGPQPIWKAESPQRQPALKPRVPNVSAGSVENSSVGLPSVKLRPQYMVNDAF